MTDRRAIKPLHWVFLFLFIWLSLSFSINTAQYGDNFEQFVWSHGLEIGYWKHPPLTTWLLIGLNALIGVNPFNTYLICFACLTFTAYFYRRLAGLFLSPRAADFSLLLLATSYMFTWRAQLLNHNLTLVMMTVVTVWYFFDLMKKDIASRRQWLMLGGLAAMAMLAKYQSVIALFGILVAFFLLHKHLSRGGRQGFGLAFLGFFALFAPHLIWFYQHYALISQYTFHFFSFTRSFHDNVHMLTSFLLQQIRFFISPLLMCLTIFGLTRFAPKHNPPESQQASLKRVFFLTQVLLPVACVVLLNQAAGMILANHWGFSVFIFLPILLASMLESRLASNNVSLVKLFFIFQFISLSVFVGMKLHAKNSIMTHRYDEVYPAQLLSNIVVETWNKATGCPLKFIDGPPFEGGIVSVYSGQYPAVLEYGVPVKSPWIDLAKMKADGYILMGTQPAELGSYGQVYTLPKVIKDKYPPLQNFYWVNIHPKHAC